MTAAPDGRTAVCSKRCARFCQVAETGRVITSMRRGSIRSRKRNAAANTYFNAHPALACGDEDALIVRVAGAIVFYRSIAHTVCSVCGTVFPMQPWSVTGPAATCCFSCSVQEM